ncbi:mucosa-associated lymphoid tissue lymphoma translocation protein 1-like [Portunus trituberculatus]|uniref:mucosa-associated lymphoid tissue lymphoma translocation protein 1-like n=1 Tax=Portunus trituberculatus TaxID=210409 RepID=UPI001E1CCD91|nr:mucosa-associated lymphoid tissue lymphoma translocation protein 1-like [Portunus trituberculatus]
MELDVVQANELVEELPNRIVESILHELSKDNAWQKVANKLKEGGENIMSTKYKMNNFSPERELLTNLMNKYPLKVKTLQIILEQCQIYGALRIINTNDPAEILEPKEDKLYLVPLGGNLTLHVKVNGSPFPEIQWCFNGNPLIGKTFPLLMLENISLRDVGEYTCKIKQGLRAELTSAKCIVKLEDTPPRISTDLNDVHIKTSEDLTLSFEAIGYPEPKTFRWFKNGNNFRVTEYPQLIIRGADVNNAGEYRCEASNPLGSCTTRTAVVKVQDSIMMCSEEIQIIQQPTASEVYYAGDWMYLTCKVHYCKDVKFVCFLNNKVLTGNDDVVLTTSSSGNQHSCILIYHMTEEQVEKENVKQLCFKFGINGQVMSDDVRVEVKTRTIKKTLTARNKWALLIGNSRYQELDELPASRKDIHMLKKNFKKLGFRVFMFNDLKRSGIQNAVKKFVSFVQEGDYVSFYYAGHGVHNNGQDYIIPVDAGMKHISRPQNVCLPEQYIPFDECISHVWIANVLQKHEPALIFSIYDSCRRMKQKFEKYQSNSSEDSYQIASKNSFTLFATSENYEAFEREEVDTSCLIDTLLSIMTHKISVQKLSNKVLERFDSLGETKGKQVPKVCGDLAQSRSLADPSHPRGIDESECGVLKKWEQFASGRGRIQHIISLGDTKIEESIYWNIEPCEDGVTWIITNSLPLTINLSHTSSNMQEINVHIKLNTELKLLQDSRKLNGSLTVQFLVHDLQELKDHIQLELYFTYKGQQYKQEMLVETPAISQQFYRGNQID